MPINMTLRINDAHRRVGMRRLPSPHRFTDPEWRLAQLQGPRIGVWFSWSRKLPFIHLRAWGSGSTQQEEEFGQGRQALQSAYEKLGPPPELPAKFFSENEVVAGVVLRDGQVRLLFCVDTDLDEFKDSFAALGQGARLMVVPFKTVAFDGGDEEERGTIRLELSPGDLPPLLDGYLGIDVGNTSCAVAVHNGALLRTRNLWVVDGETPSGPADTPEPTRSDRPASAGSAVRIDVVDTDLIKQGFRDHPAAFDWAIGARALERSTDGVVLGAKRWLARPDYNTDQDVQAWTRVNRAPDEPRVPVPLPRRLPAELLLCRLFQRFREASLTQLPKRLAITYPTSYSQREISRVREGACRAITRQNAFKQTEQRLAESGGLIHRMIDEASAAAFYFLFVDIVETPPGLLRFHYLYPRGQNLLLLDCGGGTTDIALVRASAPEKGVLRVEVRGRSGVRGFGGDDITAGVFRLLKAAIAAKVQEVRGTPVSVPPNQTPEVVARLLDERANDIDAAVPTRYQRNRMNAFDRRCRDHTRHLWQRATLAKHQLEKGNEEASAQPYPANESFGDPLSQSLIAGLTTERQQHLRDGLRGIRIRRKDIDALVRPRVERSVRCCNALIRRCLVEQAELPEEVHRFVLLGNGSRYPLVRQLLRAGLHVPFYDERLVNVAEGNLKAAVAKGAALAVAVDDASLDLRIDFDWSTTDRLPFDVGVPTKLGLPRWLFREGERFTQIAGREEAADVVAPGQGVKATTLQLIRRWPGDEDYERYLQFDFTAGVQGQVIVQFDPIQEFRVTDSATGLPGKLIGYGDTDAYMHPVERGTL